MNLAGEEAQKGLAGGEAQKGLAGLGEVPGGVPA